MVLDFSNIIMLIMLSSPIFFVNYFNNYGIYFIN